MKEVSIYTHCDGDNCKSRPVNWQRDAFYFSRASDAKGRHIYLGPCECTCLACTAAKDCTAERLGAP